MSFIRERDAYPDPLDQMIVEEQIDNLRVKDPDAWDLAVASLWSPKAKGFETGVPGWVQKIPKKLRRKRVERFIYRMQAWIHWHCREETEIKGWRYRVNSPTFRWE